MKKLIVAYNFRPKTTMIPKSLFCLPGFTISFRSSIDVSTLSCLSKLESTLTSRQAIL